MPADEATELHRLRTEVFELKGSLEAERLARFRLEGRFDDLFERFENLAREHDANTTLAGGVGALRLGVDEAQGALSGPPAASADTSDALAALAAAQAQYLREESANASAASPAVGTVDAGDESYWAAHRTGSWQGEVRDDGVEEDTRPRKVTAATEDDYWSQHCG
ncbi:hypothetical protein KFE25_009612 [Diacronema lutheri]|uniref:Uncharacterized protein n=1 Tax=Diacronema lutheri TaxID=2081491 RepID=A0A8J5XKU0_DIALT|nr:hypothetical protein KFE25_009612 [Diacronema lutheri]